MTHGRSGDASRPPADGLRLTASGLRPPASGSPLSSVPEGQCVRLVGVDAGAGLRSRLAAMGLMPGVPLLVRKNRGNGPAVVEVKGTRLALGRGMTTRILVQPLA